jgi:hypothetical protein
MSEQHVLIRVSGGAISVAPSPVRVSKKNKDEVVWKCADKFAIDFIPVGPFGQDHIDPVPTEGPDFRKRDRLKVKWIAKSGKVEENAAPGDYKYSVTSSGITLDPGVHVDP